MIVLLLLFLSIICWRIQKKALSATFLWAFTCNGFYLKGIDPSPINLYNLLFVFLNIILIIDVYKSKIQKELSHDNLLKCIIIFYVFLLIHCFISIILGIDTFKCATSVLRQTASPLLLLLIARKMTLAEIKKAFQYILIIMGGLCFLYFLQVFNIYSFQTPEGLHDGDSSRVGNLGGVEFCLLFALFSLRKKYKSTIYLIPLIYGASRGPILSLIVGILYAIRNKLLKAKYLIRVCLIGIVLFWGYTNFLSDRFNRYDVSFTEEVLSSVNLKKIMDFSAYTGSQGQTFSMQENGTFVFRISMLAERFMYLLDNPHKLLFGAGMIAEESPKNNFHFYLGTVNDNYKYGYCQIVSNDILWSSYLLRFGLCGILFWILFFYFNFQQFNKRYDKLNLIGLSYIIFLILNSFGSDSPQRLPVIFMLFLIYTCSKQLNYDS